MSSPGTPVFVIDEYYLTLTLLVTLGWQLIFMVFAITLKSDKVTDFAFGSNFVALALITFLLNQTYFVRNILVFIFVTLWGFRLAFYLLARVIKEGKDARFDDTRDKPLKFAAFWILQFITVWVMAIPFTLMNSRGATPPLGWQDGVGIGLWVIGFFFETVGDAQKFRFKNKPGNKKRMCTVGLWTISRHPNYFGELLMWWGIWAMATAVFDAVPNGGFYYFSVVGPLFITLAILFGSGLPTLEKPWDKRYGTRSRYRHYKLSTPPLVPWVPASYEKCPRGAKTIFCCEFPMYWSNWPSDEEAAVAQQEEQEQASQKQSSEDSNKTETSPLTKSQNSQTAKEKPAAQD